MPILLYRQNVPLDPTSHNRDRLLNFDTYEFSNINSQVYEANKMLLKSLPLFALFSTRPDVYAVQDKYRNAWGKYGWHPDKKGKGVIEALLGHIIGSSTIGFYQIYQDMVKWICFDVDDHSDESKGEKGRTVDDVIRDIFSLFAVLNKYEVPFLFEASGSPNSYHIWVFLKKTVTLNAFMFAQQIAFEANFKGEIFPKQDCLPDIPDDISKKTLGNLVKCPLGVNRKSGVRSQFLNPDVYNPITRTFKPIEGSIPIPKLVELLEVSGEEASIAGASQHKHRQTSRRKDSVLDISNIPAWNGKELPLRPCMKGIVEKNTSLDKVGAVVMLCMSL